MSETVDPFDIKAWNKTGLQGRLGLAKVLVDELYDHGFSSLPDRAGRAMDLLHLALDEAIEHLRGEAEFKAAVLSAVGATGDSLQQGDPDV